MIFLRQAQRAKVILKELFRADFCLNAVKRRSSLHNTHDFATRFHPTLPRKFIEALTEKEDVVLDPMCGSGTTVIEAALTGRVGVGLDCDLLSVKLSRMKTCRLDLGKVKTDLYRIVNNAFLGSLASSDPIHQFLENHYRRDVLRFFYATFSEEAILKLACLAREIQRIEDANLRNFFEVILSSIVLTHAKRPRDTIKLFLENGTHAMRSLQEFSPAAGCVSVIRGDCKNLPFGDNEVDFVMTGPPYGHSLNRLQAHRPSLYWLGRDEDDLARCQRLFIGGQAVAWGEPGVLEREGREPVTHTMEAGKAAAGILGQYLQDMAWTLSEIHRVLKPDKAAIVVLGPVTIGGMMVPTHEILGEIARSVGFQWIGTRAVVVEGDGPLPNGNGIGPCLERDYVMGLVKSGY